MQWQYIPTEEEVKKNKLTTTLLNVVMYSSPIVIAGILYFFIDSNFEQPVLWAIALVAEIVFVLIWNVKIRHLLGLKSYMYTIHEQGFDIQSIDDAEVKQYRWSDLDSFSFDSSVYSHNQEVSLFVNDPEKNIFIKKKNGGLEKIYLQNNQVLVKAELQKYLSEKK